MASSRDRTRLADFGLLLANAIPLVGVIAFDWNLHSLLLIYWLESSVVGLSYAVRISRATGEDDPAELPEFGLGEKPLDELIGKSNRWLVAFFAVTYGGFWLFDGIFVVLFPHLFDVTPAAGSPIAIATLGLLALHAADYWLTFIGDREYERTGPVALIPEPFHRIYVLHYAVFVGIAAFVLFEGATSMSAVPLLILIVVKTGLDLREHLEESDHTTVRSRLTALIE